VRHTGIVCLVLLCFVADACGDSIVVSRMKYDRLTIVDLSGEFLVCTTLSNAVIRKKLADITRIHITDDPVFNKAEALRAEKKYARAVEQYASAANKAEAKWHKALIEYRLSQIRDKTTSRPKTTTAPAATRPAGTWRELPGLLADSIKPKPKSPRGRGGWSLMSRAQQKIALAKYSRQVDAWRASYGRYRNKKVSWTLVLKKVSRDIKRGYLVEAAARGGITVTSVFPYSAQPVLLKLKRGNKVRIAGVIDALAPGGRAIRSGSRKGRLPLSVTLRRATIAKYVPPPPPATRPASGPATQPAPTTRPAAK